MFLRKSRPQPQITQIVLLIGSLIIFCGFVYAEGFIYDSHGKKDPFAPPVLAGTDRSGAEMLAGIDLEGIIWDENKPVAIINDKVVNVGDEISGAKVIKITQNEVTFYINGQYVHIKLQSKTE